MAERLLARGLPAEAGSALRRAWLRPGQRLPPGTGAGAPVGGLHGHAGLPLPPQRSTLPGTDSWQEDRCSLARRKAGRHVSLAGGRQVWPGQGRKAQKRRGHAAPPWRARRGLGRLGVAGERRRAGGPAAEDRVPAGGRAAGGGRGSKAARASWPFPAEVGAPATRGGLATRGGAACFGAAGGGAGPWKWKWEGGRGWARRKRGGRKTSSCSCSCSQLERKDALRRTEGSWGGGAGGGRQRVCGERQWRGEDGCVCPAGQKAGLSGVGFEPTPPEETVIRIQCL